MNIFTLKNKYCCELLEKRFQIRRTPVIHTLTSSAWEATLETVLTPVWFLGSRKPGKQNETGALEATKSHLASACSVIHSTILEKLLRLITSNYATDYGTELKHLNSSVSAVFVISLLTSLLSICFEDFNTNTIIYCEICK